MVKLANNTYFQLGVFMSSAMVGQTIGFNQSTHALGLNNPLIPQLAPLSQSDQKSFAFSNQGLYLANANSLPKPSSLVYQVKEGDTITKIASEYQIPSHELIELNQIPDSNFIFVDQRLQIPLKKNKNHPVNSHHGAISKVNSGINLNESNMGKSSSPKIQSKIQPKIIKANVVSSVSTTAEDPYIGNLRAEIEQLRAQNALQDAAENTLKQQPQLIGNADKASLVSVTKQQQVQREKFNSLGASVVSTPTNLIKENALALKLPPLPSSEAYLPNIFDGYTWPAEGVLTSGYGWRWGRMHEGIDIAAPIGTPILAAASGVVTGAGWHEGYGNLIKLEHLDGSITLYGHINRILVTHGQQVKQGEQIAEMGSTGRSTGSHLHFEIHLRNEQIVDPLTLLSSR
jgi:murein DD-endopeptidase MepM/ murein hydrolase activator NlpD